MGNEANSNTNLDVHLCCGTNNFINIYIFQILYEMNVNKFIKSILSAYA